jgi:hypothetical protein
MEWSASWEADSHLVCQEIPHLLWNLEVHYHATGPYPEPAEFSLHPCILF